MVCFKEIKEKLDVIPNKFDLISCFQIELLSKLEEKYGYKPSWREAYDCFKANLHHMDLDETRKEEFRKLFKSITKFCEDSEIT